MQLELRLLLSASLVNVFGCAIGKDVHMRSFEVAGTYFS